MHIKMNTTVLAATDGINAVWLTEGEVYDVPDAYGGVSVEAGDSAAVDAPPEQKDLGAAEENKAEVIEEDKPKTRTAARRRRT